MLERLVIAGSGGQGVILAGRLLAAAALETVPQITFFPSYGAEVRGGASSCQVTLSSDEISSPLSSDIDSILLMSQESLRLFSPQLTPQTLIMVNQSLCKAPPGMRSHLVPASEMANQIGDMRVANFIMLGAYLKQKPVVLPAAIEAGIRDYLSGKEPRVTELNLKAFRSGMEYTCTIVSAS